jgi:hypothetical protein
LLFCDGDALSSALYFAGPAGYTGLIVHNHGFLTFKARYLFQFEDRDGA